MIYSLICSRGERYFSLSLSPWVSVSISQLRPTIKKSQSQSQTWDHHQKLSVSISELRPTIKSLSLNHKLETSHQKSQSQPQNWNQQPTSQSIQVNTTGHFWTKVIIKYIKKWDSSIIRVWYSWIVWSYLSFSEKPTFYILSPNWLSVPKWDQLSWWSFFSSSFIWILTDIYTRIQPC